jgi:two-component system, cell cycle response regulator DivK
MRALIHDAHGAPPPAARVLIVDDAEDNREMYATYLEHAGFRVAEAATALQALDQIEREPPDLMVIDIALPGIDGVELCQRLKRQRYELTRVITLTGLSLAESEIARALDAGSDAVLFKPCLPDRLLLEIKRVLARSAELRVEASQARDRAFALSRKSDELQQRSVALYDRRRLMLDAINRERLMERIRRAYDERPALALTVNQATFLWSVDAVTCRLALNALAEAGVLTHTDADIYVRASLR